MKTTITPEIAKEMLENNISHNRKLSLQHVDFLAKEMKSGNWIYNGDSIRFDDDGDLIDGQHRLHAVVASGISITANVIEGLDKESFRTIDCGKKRLMRDFFSMDYKDVFTTHHTCSSVVKAVQMLTLQDSKKVLTRTNIRAVTYTMVDKYLESEENKKMVFDAAFFIFREMGKNRVGTILPQAIAIFLKTLTSRVVSKEKKCWEEDFWIRVINGDNLKIDSPAWCLRECLYRNREIASNINCYIDPFAKAWNRYAAGKPGGSFYKYKTKDKDCQKVVKLAKL